MKGNWWLAVGILLFLAAGTAALTYWVKQQTSASQPQVAPAQPVELPPGSEIRVDATLAAQNLVDIPAPMDGIANEFPVKPGEEVFEGQILGTIQNSVLEEDRREAVLELERATNKMNEIESAIIAARLEESRAAAELSRARSELARAEKAYDRQKLLNREGATPRKVFEASEKAYQTASAEAAAASELGDQAVERIKKLNQDLEGARKVVSEREADLESKTEALKAATITSPVDGLIVSIGVAAGAEVSQGTPGLFKIAVDWQYLLAAGEVAPNVAKRLQPGQEAAVLVAEVPGDGIPAKIRSIEDNRVTVEFASPNPAVRPGMSAVIRLKLP